MVETEYDEMQADDQYANWVSEQFERLEERGYTYCQAEEIMVDFKPGYVLPPCKRDEPHPAHLDCDGRS